MELQWNTINFICISKLALLKLTYSSTFFLSSQKNCANKMQSGKNMIEKGIDEFCALLEISTHGHQCANC